MKFIIGLIILAVISGIVFYANIGGQKDRSAPASNDSEDKEESKLFKLTFKDYEGKEVKLSDFEGKNLIVNSWAVWCPFCIDELPDFAKLQEEFKDEVTIIAIDRAESLSKAKKYTDDLGVTDSMVFWLDSGDNFYRSIGGFSMPETVFINQEGETVFHKRGPMKLDEMRKITKESFNI